MSLILKNKLTREKLSQIKRLTRRIKFHLHKIYVLHPATKKLLTSKYSLHIVSQGKYDKKGWLMMMMPRAVRFSLGRTSELAHA